jgi:uroporphyrinogen decarboxylase
MTPAARVRATLENRETDRPPVSFWTHFPEIDLDPPAIAAATVDFARPLGLDFVKAMPNGLYCVEDWGVAADFSAIAAGGVAKVTRSAVEGPDDWTRIRRRDPEGGALGRELDHLRRLVAAFGTEVPVLATVFSPLTIAKKLGEGAFRAHVETHPERIRDALGEIAATVAAFSARAIALGCAGVFFAVQDATAATGAQRYRDLAEPFDRAALGGAASGWFNVIHMHGDDILFDVLSGYPVHALNWHIGETEPTIAAYRAAGGTRPVLGGLRRMPITAGDRAAVRADLAAALGPHGGRGVLVSPGCVIRHPVDRALLGEIVADVKAHAMAKGTGSTR